MEEIIELEPVKERGFFLGQCYIILSMIGGILAILGGIIALGRVAFGHAELFASLILLTEGLVRTFTARALWRKKRLGLYALYLLLTISFVTGLLSLPRGLFVSIIAALWFAYFYRRRHWFR